MADAEATALRAEVTAVRHILECALTGLYKVDELERLAKGARKMADAAPPTEISMAAMLKAVARIYEAAAQFGGQRDLIAAKPTGSA